MADNRVVTELIIDGRQAAINLQQFVRDLESTGSAAEVLAAKVGRSGRSVNQLERDLAGVISRSDPAAKSIRQLAGDAEKLDRAVRTGVISQQEADRVAARLITNSHAAALGTRAASLANDNLAKSTGLARNEMVNLSRQMQDVATMAAMGQAPMQIFTSQAAQIYDIFSSSNATAGGFFRQIASAITPARVGIGGVTAAVLAGAVAWSTYDSAQREVARSLVGLGRDSGLTVQGLNAIAEAQARATSTPLPRARNTVSALAATGRIAPTMLAPIQTIEKDFAATLGIETAEANKLLADSFADPVRGAEMLAQRLGGLSLATRRHIEMLMAFGDSQKAQTVLLDAISPRLGRAAELTSFWASEWARVSGASSEALNTLGRFLDRTITSPTRAPTPIEEAEERLKTLQARQQGMVTDRTNGRLFGGLNPFGAFQEDIQRQQDGNRRINEEIRTQIDLIERLKREQAAVTAETERRAQAEHRATEARRTVERAVTTADQINSPQTQIDTQFRDAVTKLGTLRAALNLPFETRSIAESSAEFGRLQREAAGAEAAVRRLSRNNGAGLLDRRGGFLFDVTSPDGMARAMRERMAAETRMIQEADVIRAEREARTVREQQRAAQLRADYTRQQQGASAGDPGLFGATDSRRNTDIARQAQFQLSEAAKDRIRNTEMSIQALRAETQAMGGSIAIQEKVRLETQMINEARREAQRLGLTVSDAEIAQYRRLAEEMGKVRQEQALTRLRSDTAFERQTMFMSDTDRRIAGSMRQIYGDGWASQMNSAEAAQLRFIDNLRTTGELMSGFGQSMIQDLRNGASLWDAMGNAASRVGDRLLSMAMDQAIKKMLESLMGTGSGVSVPGVSLSLGGGTAGASAGVSAGGALASQMLGAGGRAGGGLEAAAAAIRRIESGSFDGRYDALGPVTRTGDRAYGAYQIMGANIPEWTRRHWGQQLTTDQFLASREAQDAVFKGQFGSYMNRFGPEGASRAWFAGVTGMNNFNASDVTGTRVGRYGQMFSRYFDQAGGQGSGQPLAVNAYAEMTEAQRRSIEMTNQATSSLNNFSATNQVFGQSAIQAGDAAQSGASSLTSAANSLLNNLLRPFSGLGGLFGLGGGAGGAGIISPFSTYSSGGYTGPGGIYDTAGIVHKGEVVWSQRDVARAGGVGVVESMRLGMRGYAEGGSPGYRAPSMPSFAMPKMQAPSSAGRPVSVTVNNNHSGAEVRESHDEQGNVRIDIMKAVGGTLADQVTKGRGQLGRAIGARFGIGQAGYKG